MSKYAYRNVSNTFFHAFLEFGSISNNFHHSNRSPGPLDQVSPRWTNSKVPCFKKPLAHRVWILTPRPNVT